MAVPKKRKSRARRDQRRSHDHLKAINYISCQNCDSMVLPHRVCPSCGWYKGRVVIEKQQATG